MKLKLKWIVVVLVLVGLASCRSSSLVNYESIGIVTASGKELTMDQVKQAIIIGGAARGWTMAPAEPGHMIGTLNLRSHVAIVDIIYDTQKYSITYKDSTNLNFGKNSDGTEYIHSNYIGWIKFLKESINVSLISM